mmetsp:Transcript_71486/g.113724  ORF Transcript_71486/g.113724 Transcript_71486/m.113724 type:complete len:262 (+) Transcript_71486:92-877(+)
MCPDFLPLMRINHLCNLRMRHLTLNMLATTVTRIQLQMPTITVSCTTTATPAMRTTIFIATATATLCTAATRPSTASTLTATATATATRCRCKTTASSTTTRTATTTPITRRTIIAMPLATALPTLCHATSCRRLPWSISPIPMATSSNPTHQAITNVIRRTQPLPPLSVHRRRSTSKSVRRQFTQTRMTRTQCSVNRRTTCSVKRSVDLSIATCLKLALRIRLLTLHRFNRYLLHIHTMWLFPHSTTHCNLCSSCNRKCV